MVVKLEKGNTDRGIRVPQDSGCRCHSLDYPPSERTRRVLNVMIGFSFSYGVFLHGKKKTGKNKGSQFFEWHGRLLWLRIPLFDVDS